MHFYNQKFNIYNINVLKRSDSLRDGRFNI